MAAADPLDDWQAPEWHPDYGDPEVELVLLRRFCRAARRSKPGLAFHLKPFEAGGLCVDIQSGGESVAELYVSDAEDALLSLFLVDEHGDCRDELAFSEFEKGVAFLAASLD